MNKILLVLLLFLSSLYTAHSQVVFTFSSDTISASGGTVDVDVNISGFVDVPSMQFSLNWDAAVFSFDSVINITTELPEFTLGSIGTKEGEAVDDGELTVSWSRSSTAPETLPDGTRLFTMRLSGVGDLCGSTTVELANSPLQIEIVDNDFAELTVTSEGGDLDIYDASCMNNTGGSDLVFNLADVSASVGTEVCIPVTADNFTDILSFQTGVQWDPSVLEFRELRDAGLQSVTTNDAAAAQGNLNVIWVFDQAAASLANGATLFELCFEVVGTTDETTQVALVDLPNFGIEVGIESGTITDFQVNNATFTVGSGNVGNMNGVGVIAGDVFTENSPSICIPITTKNFTDLAALQVGVNFDPSILSFTGIMGSGLSNVDAEVTGGDMRIIWTADFSTTSVTLPDDAVLFEICFDVIGNDGERSPIAFVTLPNFSSEFINADGDIVESFAQDGSITIGTDTSTGPLSLTVSSGSVNRGQDICVDITVDGFTGIEGMGYALQWDATVLTFVEVRNFNLPNLGESSFSTLGSDRLALLWTPTSGQTVADGTSIYQACFRAVDPCGTATSSTISFVDGNTPLEVIGPDNEILSPQLNSGTVSIANCGVSGDFAIVVREVFHPSCSGNTNGSVNVEFTGATGAVTCLWTNDETGLGITANCNLVGVVAGSYTLTSEDQDGNMATITVVLNDPPPIVIEGDVINGSCTGTGEIGLRVSGGTSANGTYTYQWSSGLPSEPSVTSLMPGTYQVTVSDDNGCQSVQTFVVEDNSFPLMPVVTPVTDMDEPNGSIDLNPGSGVDLSYSWSTGATTQSITGLNAGTYTVTITDNSTTDCTDERSFEVGAGFISGSSLVEAAISRYNGFGVSCNGEADGMIDGEVIGGCTDGALTILLNGMAVTLPASNLPAGDHVLRIEDACGNFFEESFTLEEPDAIVNNGFVDDPNCPTSEDASDGAVELSIEGGTGTYSLTPSVGRYTTGTTIEDLPFGQFTVVVQDENGCQVMFENLEIPTGCIIVNPDECIGRSFISPNGDNVNDVFDIGCVDNNQPNNLTIYDRWGNLVMEANNYDNGWTGTDMSGEPLPEGGYMWVLTTGAPGSRDLFRGTVSILR